MIEAEARERLNVSVSVAAFIENSKGELLLVQQADPRKEKKWGPPAGGLEAHENPIQGIRREIREETGLEVEILGMIGIYTVDRGDKKSGIGFVFKGRVNGGTMKLPKGEIMNSGYFSQEQVLRMFNEGQIYRPEYNGSGIDDWMKGNIYPIEVISPLIR